MAGKSTYEELEKRIQELEQAEFERKKGEEVLRERERRFRGIFETSIDGILIFNTHSVIVKANPAAYKMYGYTEQEMIGLSGKEIIHPDYYYLFENFKKQLQDTGNARSNRCL